MLPATLQFATFPGFFFFFYPFELIFLLIFVSKCLMLIFFSFFFFFFGLRFVLCGRMICLSLNIDRSHFVQIVLDEGCAVVVCEWEW